MEVNKNLPDFTAYRILVIGDVMIDRYLTGKVDRISPEAPVPVVHLQREENRL
ncbi:MAG: D-glycero-beta-D-manno-heptose-7-phosphate kinase, partial [Bacteroidota bacterium]